MGEGSVLALDLGTSSLKCGVYSLDGEARAEARGAMRYFTPSGLSDIAVEFDPEEVWSLACRLVRECLEKAGLSGNDVRGVCTTSQRGGFVLLDGEGREVYSGPNRDVRAFFEGMEIDGRVGEEVYRLTGHTPSFLFAPARLAWLRANDPDAAERVAHVLPLGDWLGYRLSGEVRAERSALTEVGLLPVSEEEDPDVLLKLVGIDAHLMPALSRAGEQIGKVTPTAARATGLAEGTPVVAGGPDTQLGLLGMGVTEPGEMGILVGWSGPLQMVTRRPCIDGEKRTWTGRHVIQDRWVLESTTTEAGRSLEWMAQTLGMQREELAFEPKGQGDAYSAFGFLGPRIMDAKRMGMQMGGMMFATPIGHTAITRQELVNGALKGLAFAIKGNFDQLEEVSGMEVSRVGLGGGVTRVKGFGQLVADVLGREIRMAGDSDATLLGASMCASVGVGAYNSLPEAVGGMGGGMERVQPDGARAGGLAEEYERWLELYEKLDEISGSM